MIMGTHISAKVWMRVTNFPQNFGLVINCALNRKPYFTSYTFQYEQNEQENLCDPLKR